MRRFFLFIFGTIFSANFVAGFSLDYILIQLQAPTIFRWSLGIFLALQLVGISVMIGGRLLGHQPGTGMGRPLLSLLMIWNMLLALPTAVVALIWAGVWWLSVNAVIALDSPWRIAGFVAAGLPFLVALIATAYASWQLDRFRIRRLKLTIPNLPSSLAGFTIVHLSDLHIGKLTRGKVLDDIVAATTQLQPDLILFTGDLINMSLEDLPVGLEKLREMKSRYGLFLCEGNHDLIEDPSRFEAEVRASGLHFLTNESAVFEVKGQKVRILGLRWGEELALADKNTGAAQASALHRLLAQSDPGEFTILLCHHPAAFDAAAAAGIPLTLAGHTHGGQLMLTRTRGFGPWLYRYWSGLYQKGASQLIVSNGVGNWFPLRIHAPAELIHLTLD